MFSFRLPLDGFADYTWGSLTVRFSQYTHLTSRTLPELLAGFIAGRCNWSSAAEFRAHACLVHEMVHYLQDVTTGAGHWDYLVDRDLRTEWNTLSRDATYFGADDPAIRQRGEDLNARYRSRAVFVPTALLPAARKHRLQEDAAAAAKAPLDDLDPEPLFIENLLEGEAVANTYLHLEGLQGSEEQTGIAQANGAAFQPWSLPPAYLLTLQLFFTIARNAFGDSPSGRDARLVLRVACGMLRAFVDLALAHPSPQLLERTHASQTDYEPGLRMLRLIHAFNRVPDHDDAALTEAITQCDSEEVDRLVTPHCGFPYASYKEIYSDWHAIFEKEAASGRADAGIRRDTCAKRLSHPADAGYKTPSALIELRIPLLTLTRQGIVNYVAGLHALDAGLRSTLYSEVFGRTRDARVAGYILEKAPFVCPLAESHLCEARTAACHAGIERHRDFPSVSKCEVRASLEESGFWLDD